MCIDNSACSLRIYLKDIVIPFAFEVASEGVYGCYYIYHRCIVLGFHMASRTGNPRFPRDFRGRATISCPVDRSRDSLDAMTKHDRRFRERDKKRPLLACSKMERRTEEENIKRVEGK